MKKKVVVAILLFVVAFAVPVGIYSVLTNDSYDTRNLAADDTLNSDGTSSPQIVSVPITTAEVGVEYEYKVRAVDADTLDLTYLVKEKPEWLDWNEGTKTFEGTPENSDAGMASVQISVSDGKWLATQRYQIEVTGGTEEPAPESSKPKTGAPVESNKDSGKTDLSEYGLAPVTEEVSQVSPGTGVVLGVQDGQLPDTASFGGVLLLSLGFAGVCVAVFLILDAKYELLHRMSDWYEYKRGRQISLKLSDGSVLKKRRVEV